MQQQETSALHAHTHACVHTLQHGFRLYYHATACKIQRSADHIWSQTPGECFVQWHTHAALIPLCLALQNSKLRERTGLRSGLTLLLSLQEKKLYWPDNASGFPSLSPPCPHGCSENRRKGRKGKMREAMTGTTPSPPHLNRGRQQRQLWKKPCETPFRRKNRIWHGCSGLLEAAVGVREASLRFSEGGFSASETRRVSIHSWCAGALLFLGTPRWLIKHMAFRAALRGVFPVRVPQGQQLVNHTNI